MTSTNYQHHRSQSQSRFPPPPSSGGGTHLLSPTPGGGAQAPPSSGFGTGTGGFSTLERSHRSKSLDNRRDFWAPSDSASAYYGAAGGNPQLQSQPRATYTSAYAGGASRSYQAPATVAPVQHGRQSSGSGFFNDTFSVPIQKVGVSTLRNSQITAPKHYRSAIEGLNTASAAAAEQEDEEWQSFDRKVTYNHERTILPVVHSRRHHSTHYDDYDSRGAQHAAAARYAQEHDYNNQQQQQQHQQQQQQYYQQQNQQQALTNFPSYDDEYNIGGGTYGRNAGNRGAAANHQHHESSAYYHREAADGGGAAHTQHAYQYENGYGGGHHGAYRHRSGYSSGAKSGKGGSNGWFGAHHYHHQHGALPMAAKPKRPVVHHKVHCCCFSFKWPPWGYEPCEPPTPMFYSSGTASRRGVLIPPPPSIGAQTPRLSPRKPHHPPAAQPLHYGPADQLPPPPPPLVVGPGGAGGGGGPPVSHPESVPPPPAGMDHQPHGRYSPPPPPPPPPPQQQQTQHNRY